MTESFRFAELIVLVILDDAVSIAQTRECLLTWTELDKETKLLRRAVRESSVQHLSIKHAHA